MGVVCADGLVVMAGSEVVWLRGLVIGGIACGVEACEWM